MSLSFSKCAVLLLVSGLSGCSSMKRLDLIAEQEGEVVAPAEAGTSAPSTPTLDSTTVEPLPTEATSDADFDAGKQTVSPPSMPTQPTVPAPPPDAGGGPTTGYPCPPSKPYRLFNGTCAECSEAGAGQCGPGYSCEIGRYVCRPFCSSDRECMLREDWPLPVCDERYLFCRGCQDSFECSPGLVCQFFQCVPPTPPPPDSTSSDVASTWSQDAAAASSQDTER